MARSLLPFTVWSSLQAVTVSFLICSMASLVNAQEADEMLPLNLQWQQETSIGSGCFALHEREELWKAHQTAIIVCDVWDYHHCLNAVRRLEEMAPRLNEVLTRARQQGVTIIHAPSDCMPAYVDHPARQRAINTPLAARHPRDIAAWCSQIPAEERAVYPIDQSDGGEDDNPEEHAQWAKQLAELGRNPNLPWQRQSKLITIDSQRDYISDRGDEIWNILESQGIQNVILTGVHVNMCVLGRPFGLRQMARNGKHVVLMRDMTDAMYNPKRWPYVSHFTGNDLILAHIERYICPTITSDQILGGTPFRYSTDTRPHVVAIVAEQPYDTRTTLQQFALEQLGQDFRVTILHADEVDRNHIPGLQAVQSADVLLLSIRRRVLPVQEMQILRDYVRSGNPVIALRTSSHAFSLRDASPPEGYADWPEFDADVLGGDYHGSYPDDLKSTVRPTTSGKTSPLLANVQGLPFVQGGHMYKTGPLKPEASVILEGVVDGHDPEPVAWSYSRADGGKTFYTALGHPADFRQPAFVSLLRNAVYRAANRDIPPTRPAADNQQHWQRITIPAAAVPTDLAVPAWYRCVLQIPETWSNEAALSLQLPPPLDTKQMQAFVNGESLVAIDDQTFRIPHKAVQFGDHNLLVLRVAGPQQALTGGPRVVTGQGLQIALAGTWQFRRGSNALWPQRAKDEQQWHTMPLPAKFGGGADIVFHPEAPLWEARPLTRPHEFTPGIEGPACDREGNLYAVNFQQQGTIGRVDVAGAGEVFVTLPPGSVGNGIRFNAAGDFFVADYMGHNVLRVHPATRKVTIFAHNAKMNQPNDLAIADDGTLYASDPNWAESTGQLWRIDSDGTTTLLASGMGTTNGLDLSPDGKTLYVNESVQRNIWAFTVDADRQLTDKRLVRMFDDHGFDGMRTDVDGNLYIARYGKGTVIKLSPQGDVLQEVDVLGARPSNVCFGGPDGRTVYVTEVESGRIVTFRVDRPGRSWSQWRTAQ